MLVRWVAMLLQAIRAAAVSSLLDAVGTARESAGEVPQAYPLSVSQHEEKEWLVERQNVLCWAVCTAGVVCVGRYTRVQA
jgi:hypothetical protein